MKLRDLRILIIGYLILSLLPISGFSFCVFYNISGYPCPGCGMTRAIHFLIIDHDMSHALKYHPLSLLLMPILIVAAFSFLVPTSKLEPLYNLHKPKINKILAIFATLVFSYGLIRLFYLFNGWPEIGDWFAKFQEPTVIDWFDSRFLH